jgi:FKBP-type peptidyl-prolyl cis-trans isomerase FkpA
MFSRLLILFSFCVIVSSCSKSSDSTPCVNTPPTVVVPASEMTSLQAWVAANRPAAILAPGGFYYEIIIAGTGTVAPTTCSTVSVKYTGYLTNNYKFTSAAEENTGAAFVLGGLIAGWQLGLPLITSGGTINLYLPPSLGYGASANGAIPANSILLFTIKLVAVS